MTSKQKEDAILSRQNKKTWIEDMVALLTSKSVLYTTELEQTARTKGAKLKILVAGKIREPANNATRTDKANFALVVEHQQSQDEGMAKTILREKLPDIIKKEMHGKAVREIWAYIQEYGTSLDQRVIGNLETQLRNMKLSDFQSSKEGVTKFLDTARTRYFALDDKDSEIMSEKAFFRVVLGMLSAQGVDPAIERESNRLFNLHNNKELTWQKICDGVDAAASNLYRATTSNQRQPGGGKKGNEEEKSNIALLTKLVKTLNQDGKKKSKQRRYGKPRPPQGPKQNCNMFDRGVCPFGAKCWHLHNGRQPTDDDINQRITNLCRCGTFVRVRAGIHRAAELASEVKA